MGGFSNPIIGGESNLIREAIESPNYVPGVSGWHLGRDGDVEFGSAVIRGSVIAANGAVVLDDDGLTVFGTANETVTVSPSGGFMVESSQHGSVQIDTFTVNGQGVIAFQPPDSSIPGDTYTPGFIFADKNISAGPSDQPYLSLVGPVVNGMSVSRVTLFSENQSGIAQPTIKLDATTITVTGLLYDFTNNQPYAAAQTLIVSSGSLPIGTTSVILTGINIPFPYASAADYIATFAIKNNSSGNASNWTFRTNNETGSTFDLVGSRSAATATSAITFNIAVLLTATT